jgi:Domain of unknown function (DUF6916)
VSESVRPLDSLGADDFEPHIEDEFVIAGGHGASVAARLVAVTDHGTIGGGTRASQFSVVFRGPREPVLPQAIYRVGHEQMGVLEIFLVPLGPDEDGIGYEAVFA